MIRPLAAALACLLVVLGPGHAVAQGLVAEAPASNHARLYDAVNEPFDSPEAFDAAVREVARRLTQGDPGMAEIEAQFPGFSLEMMQRIEPVIRQYFNRTQAIYRPQFIAAVAETFSEAEASQLADFYSSNIGRRMLNVAALNSLSGVVLDAQLADQDVTSAMIEAERSDNMRRTREALTAAEEAEIVRELLRIPAVYRMPELSRRTVAIQVAMNNEPMTPDEEREVERIVRTTVNQRMQAAAKLRP